jgi:hypothetical protein
LNTSECAYQVAEYMLMCACEISTTFSSMRPVEQQMFSLAASAQSDNAHKSSSN